MNESKSISPRKICEILQSLHRRAEDTKVELEASVNDTILNRREAGLVNYKKHLDKYREHYRDSKDKLLQFTNSDTLLDFIIEQSVSNPMLLVDLAKALHVEASWEGYEIRDIIDPHGMRHGY